MWWDILVGVLILIALAVAAIWNVRSKIAGKLPSSTPSTPESISTSTERKEPVFNAQGMQQSLPLGFEPPPLPPLDDSWMAQYCFVARFFGTSDVPQSVECFGELREALVRRNVKVYRLLGYSEASGQWMVAAPSAAHHHWVLLLPLADRNGGLSRERIGLIEADCRRAAGGVQQRVIFSDMKEALQKAQQLDEFCKSVDLVLELNLKVEGGMSTSEVDELLRRGNFVAENKRQHQYLYRLDSEVCFSAMPLTLPDRMVREIIFTLDTPRVSQPLRALDDMIYRMKEIAEIKKGTLYSHKQKEVDEEDISNLRNMVKLLANRMEAKGIAPGSPLSHLLFS